MDRARRFLGVVALAACSGLAGCVSTFGGASLGHGVGVGAGIGLDGSGLDLTRSSCLLTGSVAPGTGLGAAATLGSRRQQVAQIQSRHMLSAGSPAVRMESWKRLGAGLC